MEFDQQARDDLIKQLEAKLEMMIATRVDKALQQAFAGFTIQSGNGIKVSGSGRNITIAAETPPPRQLTGTVTCNDDGTATVTITG